MAKPGEVKVTTTAADVMAAARWLASHLPAEPQGTVLTGPPSVQAMDAWRDRRSTLLALACDLANRADRNSAKASFTLVLPRDRLLEFQKAYAPPQYAPPHLRAGFMMGADRFASAVDRTLSGRGRPRLTGRDRQKRLVDPAPALRASKRHQERLRRQERIEGQRLKEARARKGTVLTGVGVADFS